MPRRRFPLLLAALALLFAPPASAQEWSSVKRGSDNITVVAHMPLGAPLSVADIEIEQELDRPYVYVAREVFGEYGEKGMDVIDIRDPENPELIHAWRIENQDLHAGAGSKDIKYFVYNERYYVILSVQFGQGGPNPDLGAIIFDVTDLPETLTEVARIREPDLPGGFHNIFVYQHSNGRPLLFTTVRGPGAHVYDLGHVIDGHMDDALVSQVPAGEGPEGSRGFRGYHDLYVGWHPDTESDRFYGGGTDGYYVYDVTDLENPQMVVSLTGISGVQYGHTFTPGPEGRYVIAETEYQYAPLRIFDLQPALDGDTMNIRSPISAWTANWQNLVHNHEVRWPYVFVSGYVDGLQVFTMMDPENPRTVAYYDTFLGPDPSDEGGQLFDGAWGVDVRNSDGLIVISDMTTGFWAFRMDGFNGWSGEQWGYPDVSSAQPLGPRAPQ